MSRTANTTVVGRESAPAAAPQADTAGASEISPVQAIVNAALAATNFAELQYFSVKDFQIEKGLRPEILHGAVELTDGHIGHFHTDEVFLIVGKRYYDNGQFDFSYSLVAPTIEQLDGSFDPAKNISLCTNLRWLGTGAANRNRDGSSAPRRISLQPTAIRLNDPVLLLDGNGKPMMRNGTFVPHPCLRPGGTRESFQNGKRETVEFYRWHNTYNSNIRRLMPICAGLLLEKDLVSAETRAQLQPNAGGNGEAPKNLMNFGSSSRQYRSNVDDVAPTRPALVFSPPQDDEIEA